MRLALAFAVLATPTLADVQEVLDQQVLPGHANLAAQTRTLADAAQADCSPAALRPAYHDAYDAWISISHIHFGPIEDTGLAIAMSFWPDPKNRVGKALARLTDARDPIVNEPQSFDEVSAAAQGFTALERMLFDPQPDAAYACALTRAIAEGLAAKAETLNAAWPAFAALMTTAGQDNTNTRFQNHAEVQRALYTSLSTGLEFLQDQRLGRPLGAFDRPRPHRAEARRSARSQRHIEVSLAALEQLATTLHDGDMPKTRQTFAAARAAAARLNDPDLAGVAEPASRIRVEALQQAVKDIRSAVGTEIGEPLGISAGFNALDGD